MSAERPMLSVIDAADGRALFRQDLGSDAHCGSGDPDAGHLERSRPRQPGSTRPRAAASVSPGTPAASPTPYFPRARHGGKPVAVNYTKRGWLKANAKILAGNNAHVWADTRDDDGAAKREQIRPRSAGNWNYRMTPFHIKRYSFCDNPYPCSWNPNKPFSWRTNRNQNATQVFYFVNNWHDHLLAKPIGFTEAAGNFEKVNRTGKGKGRDAVRTQTNDGANSDGHRPAGRQPRRQRQHGHAAGWPRADACRCICSTSRSRPTPTVTRCRRPTSATRPTRCTTSTPTVCPTDWSSTADGRSTLGGGQAGAMGEAWSDWYAMDYLVGQGSAGRQARQGRRRVVPVRRRGCLPRPLQADRLQGRRHLAAM